jgi:hypothetical protein
MDYIAKQCRVMLKSPIILRGKLTCGPYVESIIENWLHEGLVLEGGVFVPWSNVRAVCPMEKE